MTAYKSIEQLLILTSILSVSLGHCAEPKKQFYFMGGGGEPKGNTTMFDDEIKRVGSFTNKSDWDTTVSFNGGHSETEELIKSKMSKAKNAGDFTEKNYNALLDQIIDRLEKNEYAAGDQVMIAIDTHGARRSTYVYTGKIEKTHKIALSHSTASELNNLSGADTVDLDKLEKVMTLAADKNVKLAVLDFSCYSGNLLNIKNDKVCMISASGPNQYSYGSVGFKFGFLKFSSPITFGSKYFDSFKKGKNLEDIFISSRTTGDLPDFPMINTPEGLLINELIYKMLSPYLDYNDEKSANFGSQYTRNGDKFEQQVCRIDNNHEQMLSFLKQYDELADVSDELSRKESKGLKAALDEYRSYQKTFEEALRGKFAAERELAEVLAKQFPNDKKAWENYSPFDLMSIDYEKQIKFYQELKDQSGNNKYAAKMWDDSIATIKRQKELGQYLKDNQSESVKSKLKKYDESYEKSGVTRSLASKVSVEAKKLYETMYKKIKTKTSNPCRDFVL